MKKIHILFFLGFFIVLYSYKEKSNASMKQESSSIEKAEKHLALQLIAAEKPIEFPEPFQQEETCNGPIQNSIGQKDFFPGSLWYLYRASKDEKWKVAAKTFQAIFEDHKYLTTNHDIGLINEQFVDDVSLAHSIYIGIL